MEFELEQAMIHHLVTAPNRYTLEIFLRDWEPSLAGNVVTRSYEETVRQRLVPGTYVFSDLELLDDAQRRLAEMLWGRLSELGSRVRLLNDPTRVLSRYALLRRLHAEGVNRFDVFRLLDVLRRPAPEPVPATSGPSDGEGSTGGRPRPRWPVFVRRENDHGGSLTPLMHTWEEVGEAALALVATQPDPQELLLVEYEDTSDARGVFRKYGAFVIGDAIVARSLMFSRHWVVKDSELFDPEFLDEEERFVAANPHADALRDIARRARVDYGRIDYAVADGRIQVWEINTNPMVESGLAEFDAPDPQVHRAPLRRIAAELRRLDFQADGPGGEEVRGSRCASRAAATGDELG